MEKRTAKITNDFVKPVSNEYNQAAVDFVKNYKIDEKQMIQSKDFLDHLTELEQLTCLKQYVTEQQEMYKSLIADLMTINEVDNVPNSDFVGAGRCNENYYRGQLKSFELIDKFLSDK